MKEVVKRAEHRVVEAAVAVAISVVLVAITSFASGGRALLARVMWNDEYVTHRVLHGPSLFAGPSFFAPFHTGVEMNLPLYHVVLKAWLAVLGGLGVGEPTGDRLLSLAFVALAGAGVYVGVRRRADPLGAAVGAALVLSMPAVIENAYQARYYAMLLAGSAWLAAMQLSLIDAPTRAKRVAVAGLAAAVTSTHWFGVLSPLAIVASVFVADRANVRRTLASTWPTIAGAAVLVGYLPLYVAQRRVMGGNSWVNPNVIESAANVARELFAGVGLAGVAICACLARREAADADAADAADADEDDDDRRTIAPLLGLLCVPVGLLLASLLVQPMMVTRYAIAATAGLGIVAATLVRRSPTWMRVLLLGALIFAAGAQTRSLERSESAKFAGVREAVAQIAASADRDAIYFDSVHALSPFMQIAPKPLTDRAVYLADPLLDATSPWYPAQRVQQGFNARLWGWPAMAGVARACAADRFWLVGGDEAARVVRRLKPRHDVRMTAPGLFRITPRG